MSSQVATGCACPDLSIHSDERDPDLAALSLLQQPTEELYTAPNIDMRKQLDRRMLSFSVDCDINSATKIAQCRLSCRIRFT
eukprot:IDg18745t1